MERRYQMRITKDPETRREEILNAALELFREEGFEKVSVESITQKAEIAKGSFYNYFKSKEDVYAAAISAIATQTLSVAKEILTDQEASPKERLKRYIDWTFEMSEQQERSLSRVLTTGANSSQKEMYLRALDEGINQMIPFFARLLEDGVVDKAFKITDVKFTAVVMLGALRGIHVAYYNDLKLDLVTSRSYLYDFLSRLLGADF
jgi:AcrR family transcriptional regulator